MVRHRDGPLQPEDLSIPNVVASGLFGDGVAAVVLAGGELELPRARPDAADPGYPLRLLSSHGVGHGLDIVDTGFKIVLSAKVPEVIEAHLGQDVDPLLSEHGLDRSRIDHWGAHT